MKLKKKERILFGCIRTTGETMREELTRILNQLQMNIYITEPETGEILFMNQKMKDEYGLIHPEGKICWEVLQDGQRERCPFCKVPELLEEPHGEILFRWREESGKLGKVFENYDSLVTWEGRRVHMQQSYDITSMEKLTEDASRDKLCGVWNRARGKEELSRSLAGLAGKHTCILVMVDIDGLKRINEFFGMSEGDFTIKKVCELLAAQVQEPDFIFRVSGDEFGVVLHDCTMKDAAKAANRWREETEKLSGLYERPYRISFSFGISGAGKTSRRTANELLDEADERMYEEKLRRRKNLYLDPEAGSAPPTGEQLPDKLDYPFEYLYQALSRSTDDFVYLCNMKTGVFRYPPGQVALFDLPGEIVKDPLAYWKQIVHPDDWDRFYKSNMEIGENKRDAHFVEFRARQRNGEYVWIRCRGQLVRDESGEPCLFAGTMHLMGRQNKVDPLTQLLNQQVFLERICQSTQDEMVERLGVLVLDVDNFRQINEMYGRCFGDQTLQTIAKTIQALLPDNAGLYRLVNDHLGILMGNAGEKDIVSLFEKIRDYLGKMKEWRNQGIQIQISAGCALYPKDGKDVDKLYQYADYAMQQAKSRGKNQLAFFTEEIIRRKSQTLALIQKLRKAVENGFSGFFLQYQPQVDAQTGELVGVEALTRFRDGEGTLVPPDEFIPVMEAEGMIGALGSWVLKEALKTARSWIRTKPSFTVSVNVSAQQFVEEHFPEGVMQSLEDIGVPASGLILELTESCAVQNMETFRENFDWLRAQGIRIALDDFGTGYSSLEALKNAPVDVVKIDRGFVKDILHSRFDAAFISFVAAMCRDAGIRVCLEGVETREEYAFVKKMELDCIQGFYFGRPQEAEKISAKLNYVGDDR